MFLYWMYSKKCFLSIWNSINSFNKGTLQQWYTCVYFSYWGPLWNTKCLTSRKMFSFVQNFAKVFLDNLMFRISYHKAEVICNSTLSFWNIYLNLNHIDDIIRTAWYSNIIKKGFVFMTIHTCVAWVIFFFNCVCWLKNLLLNITLTMVVDSDTLSLISKYKMLPCILKKYLVNWESNP